MKREPLAYVSGKATRNKWLLGIGIGAFLIGRKLLKNDRMTDLRGKVFLITGGSRGLGLAIAKQLTSKGVKLALCARDPDHLNVAASQLRKSGCEVLTFSADLRNEHEAADMVQQVISHFGRIDVLINNAGVMLVGPENVLETEDYKKVMDSNFWSAFYTTQAAIPYFKHQHSGHIVNISSIGGKIAVPHMLPYSVSKFALTGYSQGIAAELAQYKIRLTTVTPNLMRTGSPRNITLKGDHEAEYAWFKISDSLPMFSQAAEQAAKSIVLAIEEGRENLTLTMTAKLAVALQAIAPDVVSSLAQLANKYLPHSNDPSEKRGYQSESDASENILTATTDNAERDLNQL
jgi:NAD(P)-dependent dehydrogenase (short-subunit alcohol dehydrogenase family)